MNKSLALLVLHFAALGALLSHEAMAKVKAIDMVPTFSLNYPTLDCFRSFSQYHHKKSGWTYLNATINCTTGSAFIHYDRRIHDSSGA